MLTQPTGSERPTSISYDEQVWTEAWEEHDSSSEATDRPLSHVGAGNNTTRKAGTNSQQHVGGSGSQTAR